MVTTASEKLKQWLLSERAKKQPEEEEHEHENFHVEKQDDGTVIIEIFTNIDYDPENAFWIQQLRERNDKNPRTDRHS